MRVCIINFVFQVMALSKFAGSLTLESIPSGPNNPSLLFKIPHSEFGNKTIVKHSCQSSWFSKWKWLHYDEDSDAVFCHPCVIVLSWNKVKWSKGESTFVSKGYSKWRDAVMVFKNHERSDCHKSSIEAIVTLPLQCKDIGEQLPVSSQVASKKRDNRQCLLKVLSNLRYLARQA